MRCGTVCIVEANSAADVPPEWPFQVAEVTGFFEHGCMFVVRQIEPMEPQPTSRRRTSQRWEESAFCEASRHVVEDFFLPRHFPRTEESAEPRRDGRKATLEAWQRQTKRLTPSAPFFRCHSVSDSSRPGFNRFVPREEATGQGLARPLRYSHSIVPGGFEVMSKTQRLMPFTSFTIRLLMRARRS